MAVWLITGRVHTGKTGFMEQFVQLAREEGLTTGGFLARGTFTNGKRDRIRLVDIATGDACEMAFRRPSEGWIPYRVFWFNPDAFKFGLKILEDALDRRTSLLVLDEVGPLELEGKGWAEVLPKLARNQETTSIWVVRESLAETVVKRWGITVERVFDMTGQHPEALLERIRSDQGR